MQVSALIRTRIPACAFFHLLSTWILQARTVWSSSQSWADRSQEGGYNDIRDSGGHLRGSHLPYLLGAPDRTPEYRLWSQLLPGLHYRIHWQELFQESLKKLRKEQQEAEKLKVLIKEKRESWKSHVEPERHRIQTEFKQLRSILDREEQRELKKLTGSRREEGAEHHREGRGGPDPPEPVTKGSHLRPGAPLPGVHSGAAAGCEWRHKKEWVLDPEEAPNSTHQKFVPSPGPGKDAASLSRVDRATGWTWRWTHRRPI